MTRAKGFQIDNANVEGLARLADKYMIGALHGDVRNYLQVFMPKRFEHVTFDLWKFAAKYSFGELEAHCRSNTRVFPILIWILKQPKGLQTLLGYGIPTHVVAQVIADIAGRVSVVDNVVDNVVDSTFESEIWCNHCQEYPSSYRILQGCEGCCNIRCFIGLADGRSETEGIKKLADLKLS